MIRTALVANWALLFVSGAELLQGQAQSATPKDEVVFGEPVSVSGDINEFRKGVTLSRTGEAVADEPWETCLYNNKSIPCRRTFLCSDAPCGRFKLEWKDGISDTYTRRRDGAARNVGFYDDPRGGKWMLRGFAGVFGLINQSNNNTIIYGMSLSECLSTSALSDLCSP